MSSIFMFLSGLKDVVEVGPLALSHHVNFYAYETFVEINRDFIVNKSSCS